MNVWNFVGRIGQDCELKTTQNGKSVCEFSVAVKSGYGDNAKTTWANCVLFGKRAEGQLPSYLTKGQQVAVSGEVVLETWESNGVKGSKLKVIVGSIDLVGERKQQAQQPAQQQPQRQPVQDDFDDSIPF